MRIDASLGGQRDLVILADALHARNMSLVLDLPLHPLLTQLDAVDNSEWTGEADSTAADGDEAANASSSSTVGGNGDAMDDGAIAAARMRRSATATPAGSGTILQAMRLWLSLGVDGFYVTGLEHFHADPNLLANVLQWKRLLGTERVLIVSQLLLDRVAAPGEPVAAVAADDSADEVAPRTAEQRLRDQLVRAVDLVDVAVDLTHGAAHIAGQILATVGPNGALAPGDGRAQVHWSLGSENEVRYI